MSSGINNTVVVDTSLALKWVLDESDTPKAQALLTEWNGKAVNIFAPSLLVYELTNALYKKVRRGEIDQASVLEAMKAMTLVGISYEFSPNFAISTQAVKFATRLGLPATYDAHYLALAERKGCELWTADTRLWNTIRGKLSWVHLLDDYIPE